MQLTVLVIVIVLFSSYLLFSHYQYKRISKIRNTAGDGVTGCMYCNSKKLSKEHAFPDWIKPLLSNNSSGSSFTNYEYGIKEGKGYAKSSSQSFKHLPTSRKLKIVCHNCNNQWMSTLQNKNKHVLTHLISGNDVVLNSKDQQLLAAWCTMMAMVSEHVYDPPYISTIKDRSIFYANKKPLDSWHIWVAKNASHRKLGIMKLHMIFRMKQYTLSPDLNLTEKLTQPNSFVIFYLIENFMFIALYDIRNIPINLGKEFAEKIIQIHPQSQKSIPTTNLKPMNDKDITNISAFFGSLS